MTSKIHSFRPSPAMIIACVALFLTLAGTAFAATVARNSVGSAQIINGAVKTADLSKDAVRSGKIADGTIATVDLRNDSVKSAQIADGAVSSSEVLDESLTAADLGPASVTSSEIADGSVTSADVADQSLTANDLAPNSVGSSELQSGSVRAAKLAPLTTVVKEVPIKTNATATTTVACPAGTTVISGGFRGGEYKVHASASYRSGNGWHLDARNGAPNDTNIRVYAYCLSA